MISPNTQKNIPENIILSSVSTEFEFKKNIRDKDQRSPNYLALYGLRESAFSQEHDDRFFFLDTDHAQRLSLLHNLIQDHNLFLHISGESGVGKSSLINRFVNIGEEDWRFSFFSANAMMTSDQLFFNISAGFGLSGLSNNNINLKDTCIKNIALLESSGVVPILIIDDIQELSFETLKSIFELVNRWDKNHPKLRIIMISNPGFNKILDSKEIKPLRKLISHVMEIEPLTDEQIERYIYFRLSVAGLDGGNPITPEACTVISEKSKGIPEKINSLCHIALRDGMDEMTMKEFFDDHNFNFPYRKYLITGSFLAIFLGVIFSFIEPYKNNNPIKQDNDQLSLLEKIANDDRKLPIIAISSTSILAQLEDKNIKSEKVSDNDLIIKNESTENKILPIYDFTQLKLKFTKEISRKNSKVIFGIIKLHSENKKLNKTLMVTVDKKNGSKKKVNHDLSNYNIDKLTTITSKNFPEIKSISSKKLFPENSEIMISLYGDRFSKKSKITIYSKKTEKQLRKNKITFVSDNQIDVRLNPGNYQEKNWIVVTDPENGKSNSKLLIFSNSISASTGKFKDRSLEDKKWILAQQSDLYILHFVGSKNKQEIIGFAQDENISGQYAIFETNRNGTKWFHLILGTYKDRESAKSAVKKFPEEANKPWIRPIKDIQKVIKRFNQKSL